MKDGLVASGTMALDNKDTTIVVLVMVNVLLIFGCFVMASVVFCNKQRVGGYGKVMEPDM